MKKIIISMLLLIPIMVKADIDKIYIDSEVDIAGNLIVKEIIEVDSTNEFLEPGFILLELTSLL